MAEDSGYYEDPFAGQTISPTTPSWKDRIAQWMMGDQRPSVERRNFVEGLMGTSGIGPSGFGIASLTPAGAVLDAQEAAREGDYRGAALAAVPIPGASKIRGAISAAEDAALARIRAYHGSPYDFEAFDPAKMSSGFGAQAKGKGFYFSESEDVAKGYRRPSGSGPSIGGRPVNLDDPAEYLANELRFNSPDELRNTLQQEVDYLTRMKRDLSKSKEAQALDYLKSGKEIPKFDPPGKVYEVDIKSSQDNFIDWDKPFKDQSGQVQAKISERFPEFPKDKPVGEILQASPALEELGLAGVKFRQDGVTNYSVFNPEMIDIVQKYANGGLVSPLDRYLNALGTIESSNNYSALGPRTESGNRAYGRYQVMDFNIPTWTQEALGQSMTPDQFLANKEAQDAVARAKFGEYVAKTGNPFDAASMWFSGRPMAQAGEASDVTGTSVPQYVSKFANALGMPMEQDATGIAALDAEELALARERMAMDQGPDRRQRNRMISAITDYYQSLQPKQADFSLLRPTGRRG